MLRVVYVECLSVGGTAIGWTFVGNDIIGLINYFSYFRAHMRNMALWQFLKRKIFAAFCNLWCKWGVWGGLDCWLDWWSNIFILLTKLLINNNNLKKIDCSPLLDRQYQNKILDAREVKTKQRLNNICVRYLYVHNPHSITIVLLTVANIKFVGLDRICLSMGSFSPCLRGWLRSKPTLVIHTLV